MARRPWAVSGKPCRCGDSRRAHQRSQRPPPRGGGGTPAATQSSCGGPSHGTIPGRRICHVPFGDSSLLLGSVSPGAEVRRALRGGLRLPQGRRLRAAAGVLQVHGEVFRACVTAVPGRGRSGRCAVGLALGPGPGGVRRATGPRCRRSTVSGRTGNRTLRSASFGSWCNSDARKARSPAVSRTRCLGRGGFRPEPAARPLHRRGGAPDRGPAADRHPGRCPDRSPRTIRPWVIS